MTVRKATTGHTTVPIGAREVRLLSVEEAASVIGVSPTHMYRLIADGEIDVADVGVRGSGRPKTKLRSDQLAEFIVSRTRTTARAKRAS